MLTLLKQARAFGLGVVLATQNPVDLDYKGLSNAGTWFLGRLQTERDKARVLEGLEGASAAAGAHFDRGKMERILAGLGNRVFLLNNVHEDQPVVFQTRWALSFLRGPVNREEIARLMATKKALLPPSSGPATAILGDGSAGGMHPILPPGINETFVVRQSSLLGGSKMTYRPGILAAARVRFVQNTAGIDSLQDITVLLPAVDKISVTMFDDADIGTTSEPEQQDHADSEGGFATLPAELSRAKTFTELQSALKDHLYKTQKLTVWKCADLKETSKPGENEGDFRARIAHSVRERRDQEVEKLRASYASKLRTIQEQLRKAMQKVEKEKLQSKNQTTQAIVSVGTSILGAVFGRKLTSASNMGHIATGVRTAGRMGSAQQDVALAEESVDAIQSRYDDLNKQFAAEATAMLEGASADKLKLDEVTIAPKKTDVTISKFVLCWTPWIVDANGKAEQGW